MMISDILNYITVQIPEGFLFISTRSLRHLSPSLITVSKSGKKFILHRSRVHGGNGAYLICGQESQLGG